MSDDVKKWEYDNWAFQNATGGDILNAMNQRGQQGWEYCGQSCFPVSANPEAGLADGMVFVYLFKRPAKAVRAATPGEAIGLIKAG